MRDQFIPVRKSELIAALSADRLLEGVGEEPRAHFCTLVASILHHECFAELERLKDAYFPFNPQYFGKVAAGDAGAYADLTALLVGVLGKANFVEIPAEELARSHTATGLVPVKVRTPLERYAEIRFFRRGRHAETVAVPRWLGYRTQAVTADVYDEVVLIAALKPPAPAGARERRRLRRTGGVLIKYFRDIASADLNMLLPDTRVVMPLRDRWKLGLPALIGGIPLALKLAPTLAVLLVLLGARLGYAGSAAEDRLQQALVVLSGFVALGSFVAHQWLKYQRRALRYQLTINDAIYFRNLNNNAGIFDALIGSAEEQECKEAILAYFFLRAEPMDLATLDRRVEAWLAEKFGVSVDFEVDDGVAKLERFGLLHRDGDRLRVAPLDEALIRLDRLWDNLFRFHLPEPAIAPA